MRRRRIATRWDLPLGSRTTLWQRITPPQLFVGSFLLLVLLGTLGLKVLPGLYHGDPLSWQDALFTSTSAVCVTGLIVVDTATYFTAAGQGFILLLIQLGGLGMLAFTSLIITALGRRLSLRAESLHEESRGAAPHIDSRQLTIDVVRFTFIIEFVGAVLLYALWVPRLGWGGAIWPAVFHSVSAFCNAGFSTFSDSLIGFQQSPGIAAVIILLIVAGGIGFLTLEEAYMRFFSRGKKRSLRLSIHSQLVLITTGVLLLGGALLFGFFEWNESLAELTIRDKVSNSLFMSATARTAGFNMIDYGTATDSSNFLTILLMTIGGSPGSTAGGMKTTTFALVVVLAWSRLRSRPTAIFGHRSIPVETTQRAVGLSVIAFAVIATGVFALIASEQFSAEKGPFLVNMFEAVSAFNTVGLSMGLTPHLSEAGRWIIILLMFLGRVGPLTLAAALMVRPVHKSNFRYAYEDVVVG